MRFRKPIFSISNATKLVPTVLANGINIYYEIHGEGEPLVLIAGLSIDLTAIDSITSELSRKYQVMVFDNRGAGRTDKPDVPYSIEMMAQDTAGLLNALGVSKVHIMGISLGGRIALSLTLDHPEIVKSLILVSTGPRITNTRRRRFLFFLLEIPRRLGAIRKEYPQPYFAYKHQREASENYDATSRLNEIRTPTIILHGKKDRMAPLKLAEVMHDGIKGSKMITFDGGHLFLFFKQKEFLDSVEEFLESQKSRSEN